MEPKGPEQPHCYEHEALPSEGGKVCPSLDHMSFIQAKLMGQLLKQKQEDSLNDLVCLADADIPNGQAVHFVMYENGDQSTCNSLGLQ